jgi:hypothetical protein
MNTYAIRRDEAWSSPEELQQAAGRSKKVADSDFPDDIRWIDSYVIAEDRRRRPGRHPAGSGTGVRRLK